MIKSKKADSLIGIIIGVFILSFALVGIINILTYNKEVFGDFEEKIYSQLISLNGDNIIKKIDFNNISYNQDYYLFKDVENKIFKIFTGSTNEEYAYIDKLGYKVNKEQNIGKTYKRVFNNKIDILRHKINPNEIPELILHFDATNINGLNNSGISDGEAISTWIDLSGNGNNGIQSNSNNKPTLAFSGILYNPLLIFNGDKLLEIDNSSLINDDGNAGTNINYEKKSFAIVFKTGLEINNFQSIYEQGGQYKGYAIQIENKHLYAGVWNNSWDSGNIYKYLDMGEIEADLLYSIIFTIDSSSGIDIENKAKIYLNGNFINEIDHVDIQSEQPGLIGLGGINNNSYNLKNGYPITSSYTNYFEGGGIGEFMIFNNSLSDNDIRGLNNYFNEKWLNQNEHIIYNITTNSVKKYNSNY